MNVLNNKNCLITGASGGLGREIAKQFLKNNCNLFLTAQNEQKLKKLKSDLDRINTKNCEIFYHACDVTNQLQTKKIIKVVRRDFGPIDILINCAGIFQSKPISQTTIEDFDKIFAVNIRAPFLFCKEFSADMIKHKWGRIINIGSSSSYSGFKNGSIYCSSKHAILGLSRSLVAELKEYNIRTYAISPGSIKTKMGRLSKDQDYETFLDPKEVAKYVEFVAQFDGELISEEIRLNRINLR
ncbi:MAG: SDR family oxidoreductase [Nitrososphaerota archaeon]